LSSCFAAGATLAAAAAASCRCCCCWQAYLEYLTAAGKWSAAADSMLQLLKEQGALWERWLYVFAQVRPHFLCYLGEPNPTGWPHMIQSGLVETKLLVE
jgi:hypothetical protein